MKNNMVKIQRTLKKILLEEKCDLSIANWLEVELDKAFPQDEEIQDFITELALYEPQGGEYLLNERELIKKCESILKYLNLLDK